MPRNAQTGHNSVTHPRARTHTSWYNIIDVYSKTVICISVCAQMPFCLHKTKLEHLYVRVHVCVLSLTLITPLMRWSDRSLNHQCGATQFHCIQRLHQNRFCCFPLTLSLLSLLRCFGITQLLPLWLVAGGWWPLGLNATLNICCVLLYTYNYFLTFLFLFQLFSIYAFAFISDTLGIFSKLLRALVFCNFVANGDKELLNQVYYYL